MSRVLLQRRGRPRPTAGLLGRNRVRPADRTAHLRAAGVGADTGVGAPGGDGFTLEELTIGLWGRLSECEIVCCPICGGEMASIGNEAAQRRTGRRATLGSGGVGGGVGGGVDNVGECRDCGTRLE
jgi:hypothetical protein